jgi:hypothetical protein
MARQLMVLVAGEDVARSVVLQTELVLRDSA